MLKPKYKAGDVIEFDGLTSDVWRDYLAKIETIRQNDNKTNLMYVFRLIKKGYSWSYLEYVQEIDKISQLVPKDSLAYVLHSS